MEHPDLPSSRPPGPDAVRDSDGLRRRLALRRADLRRTVLRRRRLLAAVLLAVAVLAGLRALVPAAPPSATVLVAARDLPAGRPVGEGDLEQRSLPDDVVPDGALRTWPSGRLLAAPLRRGEVVTDVRLTGGGPALAQGEHTVAAPVRLSDAGQAALLAPGDRIDVVVGDPRAGGEASLVASCAVVLSVPAASEATDGALPGRLAVLALDDDAARRLAGATTTSYVTYTWCRR